MMNDTQTSTNPTIIMYDWVCPKCGNVWSPFTSQCGSCNCATSTISYTTQDGIYWKDTLTDAIKTVNYKATKQKLNGVR